MRRENPCAVLIVTTKNCSSKYSWCEYASHEQADRAVAKETGGWYWTNYGQHWKRRYRINVYPKGQ